MVNPDACGRETVENHPMRRLGPKPTSKETPVGNRTFLSTPGGTRTPNLLIRNQTLYPIELRALESDKGSRLRRCRKTAPGGLGLCPTRLIRCGQFDIEV